MTELWKHEAYVGETEEREGAELEILSSIRGAPSPAA
jgi:hypothetical protein